MDGALIISQGCLQYFLGATDPPHGGIITSFNWQFRFVNDGDPNTPPILDVQSKYLANMLRTIVSFVHFLEELRTR